MTSRIHVRIVLSLAIGIATLGSQANGQQAGQTPPAGGATLPPAGGGGAGTTPGRTTLPGNDRNQIPGQNDPNSRFPDMQQRPIFFSGKVMLDDGTPPPDSVVIERVCNGTPKPEAYTDSKGRFSFQLGQNQGMMQDASVGSAADGGFGNQGTFGGTQQRGGSTIGNQRGLTERDLMGCELRASLAGFRSDQVNLSGRRAFDNPDVGTIVLHRMAGVEGTSISMVAMQAPKDAKKAFDKGKDFLKKKKVVEAKRELEKAVEIYPKYSTAWFELGRIHEAEKNVEEARKAYGQALAADPKYVNPYRQLASIAVREQNWKDAADTTGRLLKLDPFTYKDAYFYNSVANYYLKQYDAAEKSAREALKLDTRHEMPKVNQLLGAILAEKQDFAGAAVEIKKYLTFVSDGQDADNAKKQLAELEKLATGEPKPAPEP